MQSRKGFTKRPQLTEAGRKITDRVEKPQEPTPTLGSLLLPPAFSTAGFARRWSRMDKEGVIGLADMLQAENTHECNYSAGMAEHIPAWLAL